MAKLNQEHLKQRPDRSDLEARMNSYELAYRMQTEVPGILDISGEKESTLESYGIGNTKTDAFGRKCLLARRLVEKGVRFVQAYAGNWDSHDYIQRAHGSLIRSVDKPIAALLKDLKDRGMLEDTLVVWGGEFGRTPDAQLDADGKVKDGRDHNPDGYTFWLAGGGVKQGFSHGQTDPHGYEAIDGKLGIHDLHATILHLLGLDHKRLTFRYSGRDFRLTDVHGKVVDAFIA